MACRALYEKNNVIYEGTVQRIDDSERTASVAMTGIFSIIYLKNLYGIGDEPWALKFFFRNTFLGYGVVFEAKFENMYESIPEYRVKQEISAKNYIKEEVRSFL